MELAKRAVSFIEKSRIEAVRLGLYPALAEDLMSTIIRYSVLRQDELKREAIAQPLGKGQEALILGGAGQMGQWFAQFYESLGFAVSIFDLINPSKNQYPRVHDLARELNRFDLLVLASPMPATIHLIEFLIAEKARGLIIEICSLKSPIQKSIRDAVAAGLKIASIHPMFGPDTDLLAGKNIIFCTDPGLHSETILKQHFQQTSAQLICLPFDEHDKQMSYVLGSAH
ncbi:MAG: prephenate dehydrogenase/arogenate dehydrogenase family protein, partial [Proteobacteria bacterium]|nr:prephenate dehydrogenase/arogenate dehydrogenase family protein [Pseudomonadota bacterium]